MKSNPDFILFGQGNYNTLGVLHQLAEIGVEPLILSVGNPKDRKHANIIGYSKYAKRIEVVNSEQDGLRWIIDHLDMFPLGTIIYPTSDNAELLLDEQYEILSHHFRFPNGGYNGSVASLMDKHTQTDLAKSAGLRILQSQYSNSPCFSFEKVMYPCMVKPLNSTLGSKGDMRVCENEAELRYALQNGKHTRDFIVQQYIHNEADLLFLGVALQDGQVWLPAVVIKPGVSPTGEYTHAIVSTDIERWLPEINEVKRFVSGLGYRGPFSIEFGLEKGKNYFFEINLRNDGTSQYPLSAGVNIAAVYINNTLPEKLQVKEFEMIDEIGDLRRVFRRQISFWDWQTLIRKAGAYRYYRQGDVALIPVLISMFFSRIFKKIYKRNSLTNNQLPPPPHKKTL